MRATLFPKLNPHTVYINNYEHEAIVRAPRGRVSIGMKCGSRVPDEVIEALSDMGVEQGAAMDLEDVANKINLHRKSKPANGARKFGKSNDKGLKQLFHESENLDLSTIKMQVNTKKNAYVKIDSREPKFLQDLLLNGLSVNDVEVASLPLGDIKIGWQDGSATLLIERKTITDFHQSIIGENHHAHSQVERYYAWLQEGLALGEHRKVIWIVESEDDGERGFFHVLDTINQIDGWDNYSLAISDQAIAHTFSTRHTAYKITKFMQGFLERRLTVGVKVSGARIDTKKRKEIAVTHIAENSVSEVDDRNVMMPNGGLEQALGYIHPINKKAAHELSKLGKRFCDVVQMTEAELLGVKHIGPKLAKRVYEKFQMM